MLLKNLKEKREIERRLISFLGRLIIHLKYEGTLYKALEAMQEEKFGIISSIFNDITVKWYIFGEGKEQFIYYANKVLSNDLRMILLDIARFIEDGSPKVRAVLEDDLNNLINERESRLRNWERVTNFLGIIRR